MANFIFEEGSQIDASGFTAGDILYFKTAAPSDVTVSYTPAEGLTTATITLTSGVLSLTFAAGALGNAADIVFIAEGGELELGTDGNDGALAINSDQDSAAYGFEGDDTITVAGDGNHVVDGGDGVDSITVTGDTGDHTLNGGAGVDTIDASGLDANTTGTNVTLINGGADGDDITGSDFVDYIYGNSRGVVAGTVDGDDTIDGGDGNDRIQGNAGEDSLTGGIGRDYILGGGDDDEIFGGLGNDTVNGNKGADDIEGEGGDDSLRGGQGDDTIDGGAGLDYIQGDLGDDSLDGGANVDLLFGGAGADSFNFAVGEAAPVTVATVTSYETIADLAADDTIVFTGIAGLDEDSDIILQADGVQFTTAEAAATYADELFDDNVLNGDEYVVAIQVGADTYLFYADDFVAATGVNSAIHLIGVTAADLEFNEDGAIVLG